MFSHTALKFFAQSFWRDEAFTYLMSEKGILSMLLFTARDYNPPLYYLIMHIWMFVFGHSEVAMRSVSLICYWATLYVAYLLLTECLEIPSRKAMIYLSLFFFNPMLVYYAYEARMYSMLAFFVTASYYALYKKNRKLYLWVTIAGLYTHYFMTIVLACQLFYTFLFHRKHDLLERSKMIAISFASFIPWLLFFLYQSQGYKEHFWIEPPKLATLMYVPAQLYTAYELGDNFLRKTSSGFIPFLFIVSLFLCVLILYASINILKHGSAKVRAAFAMIFIWAFAPSLGIFIISLYKPLFLTRYIIFATVGLLLIIAVSLEHIKRPYSTILFCLILVGTLYYQSLQITHYSKTNLAATIGEINKMAGPHDSIYVTDMLQFHVAQYYFDEKRVYIFNKSYDEIPRYIGKVLIGPDRVTNNLPLYPAKAFILYEDGHYDIRANY